MLQFIWPDTYINQIKYYESYMSKPNYVAASNNFTFYKNTYLQPSLAGISTMRIFGLATEPKVSVTYEGQSMKDFTFTVFHEIAHIFYDTLDEVVANSFAVLYNNSLWNN